MTHPPSTNGDDLLATLSEEALADLRIFAETPAQSRRLVSAAPDLGGTRLDRRFLIPSRRRGSL